MEPDCLHFYGAKNTHGFLSNFYPSPFAVGATTYPTAEHYFQSQKFKGHPHEITIAQAPTPATAFKLGRSREFPCRSDWNSVKEDVMYTALQRKFSTHANLRE
jgi:N-glycosidase YbiA